MADAAKEVMPDVKTPVEPCIHRQLSKLAEPVRDNAGKLIPWDVWEQAALARDNPTRFNCFPRWVTQQIEKEEAA